MNKTFAIYSLSLLAGCLMVVILMRFLIPHDHSYGSVAVMVLVFIYPLIVKTTLPMTLAFGALYTCTLLIDSLFQFRFVTGAKSSESIVLMVVAGAIVTVINIAGFLMRNYAEKLFYNKNT